MKMLISILTICYIGLQGFAANNSIVLEGVYQNKNLYVNNCSGSDGVGFSVNEVRVNGELTTDQVQSSAFEIDLTQFGFAEGQEITVQIIYDGPCTPKVLNPDALQPEPTYEIQDIKVDPNGLLKWSTTNEKGSLPFSIEQFKWNKWVKIGEVNGNGTPTLNEYQFQTKLVSGNNKFRVVQKNNGGSARSSVKHAVIEADVETPTFEYNKKQDAVVFSKKTSYEVYDMYGQIRKRGFSKEIDFSNLEKGTYYLNYDNNMDRVKKK